ncbi:MAG: Ig domain-containing protein, partial [Deferribacterales bacterium]|nr:Ig domain-containing protein [Deferribacterales bacterium]
MKKFLLMLVAVMFLLVGCGGGGGGGGGVPSLPVDPNDPSVPIDPSDPSVPVVKAEGIVFSPIPPNPIELNLNSTKAYQLSVVVEPAGTRCESLTYNTSDSTVATVDGNGLITGKSVGTAEISAKCDDLAAITANVNVIKPVPTSISFSPAQPSEINFDNLGGGMTYQLLVDVNPAGTSCESLSYTSSDDNVASVDGSGFVTGKSSGTA